MTFNLSYSGATGPLGSLLKSDCVGCHTNAASTETIVDLGNSRVPIVYNPGGGLQYPPEGGTNAALAGGNFYWVDQDQANGHNVFVTKPDTVLTEAPGRTVRGASSDPECANCHMTLATAESGCQGCHLAKHHADDSAEVVSMTGGWYRFLGDLMLPILTGNTSTNGVMGIEEPNWEQNPSESAHNGYFGTTNRYSKSHMSYLQDYAIGQFCTGCHGAFHHPAYQIDGSGMEAGGAWIRHPSDVLLPDEGEYASYNTYDPMAPIAKPDLAGQRNSSVVEPGTDIVNCISCHRAHGSPYPDMLRWDYGKCETGNGDSDCGCYSCHTGKD